MERLSKKNRKDRKNLLMQWGVGEEELLDVIEKVEQIPEKVKVDNKDYLEEIKKINSEQKKEIELYRAKIAKELHSFLEKNNVTLINYKYKRIPSKEWIQTKYLPFYISNITVSPYYPTTMDIVEFEKESLDAMLRIYHKLKKQKQLTTLK